MLVYKALYRKMMDDLKDAGMWLDWAEQIMCDYPECAEFLIESAEERLDKTFVDTYKHFETLCKEHKADICMDEIAKSLCSVQDNHGHNSEVGPGGLPTMGSHRIGHD